MERRRWLNPAQPQTLQIAVFLNYFHAAFAVLGLIIQPGAASGARLALLLAFYIIGPVLAGWGLANEFKWAYPLAIVVALLPFILRFFLVGNPFSTDILNLMFEIALVALLLHPQSRDYQRIWFK